MKLRCKYKDSDRRRIAVDIARLSRTMKAVDRESSRLGNLMLKNEHKMRPQDLKWYKARIKELTTLLDKVNDIPHLY